MGAWPCGQDSGFTLALVQCVGELERSPSPFVLSFLICKMGISSICIIGLSSGAEAAPNTEL